MHFTQKITLQYSSFINLKSEVRYRKIIKIRVTRGNYNTLLQCVGCGPLGEVVGSTENEM